MVKKLAIIGLASAMACAVGWLFVGGQLEMRQIESLWLGESTLPAGENVPARISSTAREAFELLTKAPNIVTSVSSTTFLREGEAPAEPLQSQQVQQTKSSPPPYSAVQVAYEESRTSADNRDTGRDYVLQKLTIEQLERRLLDVWGNRLQFAADSHSQKMNVSLPTREFGAGSMTIDPANRRITFNGPAANLSQWRRAMTALDSAPGDGQSSTEILDTQKADPATIQKAVALLDTIQFARQESGGEVRRAIPLNRNPVKPGVVGIPTQEPAADPNAVRPQDEGQQPVQPQEGLSGPVRVEVIPELNLLILYGKPEDVAYVQKVLANLIQSADTAQPEIEVYPLKNASGQGIATNLQTLYDNNFAAQQGPVSITALDQPNGLLLIGRKENIATAKKLIDSLDVAPPDQPEQFRTFRLQYMSAVDAQSRLNAYFNQGQQQAGAPGAATTPAATPLTIVADYRSNSIIVKSGTANLALVEKLLNELDVVDSAAKNEVRVIPVHNAVAADLAVVLQDAINGQLANSGQGFIQQNQGAGGQLGGATQNRVDAQAPGDPATESRIRSAMLELMTVDRNGNPVDGGILFDVRVTADANSNSLVVTGPTRSMGLITALVERLDVVPDIEVKIKVFRLVHGDAPTLLTALQQLFGGSTQSTGFAGGANQTNSLQSQLPLQSSSAQNGATLAGMRFSVDTRTNTLIVSGPAGDLQVIEDLIIRLDEADVDMRSVRVYRLSNAPAEDVAQALNAYIDSRRDIIAADPGAISAFEQVRRELIVIPEIVSNSLLISATPEYFAELEPVIQSFDRRPAMVKVKVLLAQVTLNALDEFGVELGLQDSLLFDRGIGQIGFPFNQQNLGNILAAQNSPSRELLAGQALSNFSLARGNSNLGYGGLVLSAGNESINILIRALEHRSAIRVLAKPYITTVDNLLARVQVGQRVPTVTAVNETNAGGFSNSIEYTDVGIILEITPRVSPDGTIVMLVNATNSSLDDVNAGIPIFTDANGNVIRSPIINETTAETTIMARSGQTVVLSGLMQNNKSDTRRGIPVLSDLPVLGPLFRFDAEQQQRSELLIVMTPYLINGDEAIDTHNHTEYDRMHWCLGDVNQLYGSLEYEPDGVSIEGAEQPPVYYPDADPMGQQPQTPPPQNPVSGDQSQFTPSAPAPRFDPNSGSSIGSAQNMTPMAVGQSADRVFAPGASPIGQANLFSPPTGISTTNATALSSRAASQSQVDATTSAEVDPPSGTYTLDDQSVPIINGSPWSSAEVPAK